MKSIIKIAVVSLALAACGQANTGNTSTSKDLIGPGQINVPQQVTTLIPTGQSVTPYLTFAAPIRSSSLEIHTTCTVQLTQIVATYDFGQTGLLQPSSYSANIWLAPSGQAHTWQTVQLTVVNYGQPTWCTYTISAPMAIPLASNAVPAVK